MVADKMEIIRSQNKRLSELKNTFAVQQTQLLQLRVSMQAEKKCLEYKSLKHNVALKDQHKAEVDVIKAENFRHQTALRKARSDIIELQQTLAKANEISKPWRRS
jgi:hypothetical protein